MKIFVTCFKKENYKIIRTSNTKYNTDVNSDDWEVDTKSNKKAKCMI